MLYLRTKETVIGPGPAEECHDWQAHQNYRVRAGKNSSCKEGYMVGVGGFFYQKRTGVGRQSN